MEAALDFENLLCDPLTKDRLHYVSSGESGAYLENVRTGVRFPMQDDIVNFLGDAQLTGQNLRYQKLYNRFAWLYNISTQFYAFIRSEGERRRLGEYLRELEITPNGDVLEVAIGTGRNVKYLPQMATYFGIDISLGMLKQCRKLSRKKLRIHLFLGEAEHLPFVDDAFDTVYHVGGINFFNDKAGALQEMIRVAKPGSKLLVVDETEKVAKKYERARSSEKRLYRSRSSIERVNSRLKEQLCLEKHRVKGLRRITIHALFCLIAMLLNAVAALRLGKREQARSMSLLAK